MLTNGELDIGVTGAEHKLFLPKPKKKIPKPNHLSYRNINKKRIMLVVHTHRLYMDIVKAAKQAKLITNYRGSFKTIDDREINCSIAYIENALKKQGHKEYKNT